MERRNPWQLEEGYSFGQGGPVANSVINRMKNNNANRGLQWVVLAGLAAALSVRPTQADVILNQFNSASEVSAWRFDFGNVTHSEAFDPTQDANRNAASGSIKVTLGFDATLAFPNKRPYT